MGIPIFTVLHVHLLFEVSLQDYLAFEVIINEYLYLKCFQASKRTVHIRILSIETFIHTFLPNQELSVLYGGPTLNYGGQLSLYVLYMLRLNMTGDLAHLQLSDLQGETRPVCRTSDLQGERMLICRT